MQDMGGVAASLDPRPGVMSSEQTCPRNKSLSCKARSRISRRRHSRPFAEASEGIFAAAYGKKRRASQTQTEAKPKPKPRARPKAKASHRSSDRFGLANEAALWLSPTGPARGAGLSFALVRLAVVLYSAETRSMKESESTR